MFGGGGTSHLLLRRLARRPGHWVPMSDLVAAAFADCEDGGPDDPESNIRVIIHRLRDELASSGWGIQTGTGPAMKCFRLVLA